jgi:glycosyltransferase involved in cell wall biosynthesis
MAPRIPGDRPLRILVIVGLPWDVRLGACRVWMELARQWRALGHTVEQFSFSEVFPAVGATGVSFALQQIAFVRKAAAFVRANRDRFDIIDAAIGTLPFSRSQLGFRGAIVARSVGLYRFYSRFEESVKQRWPELRSGKLVGRVFYGIAQRRLFRASEKAVRTADLINVPNEEEAACLRNEAGVTSAIIVQPYGLTNEYRRALEQSARDPEYRLAQKRICFIGAWSARKGAHDWARIIKQVHERVPGAKFRFLGTMIDDQRVRRDLGFSIAETVELIPSYQPEELPGLLADCTVGAFPSYAEGFGLAVLEQLAAGLPTVAYDIPGPSDLLKKSLPELLVPKGSIERFAAVLCDILLQPAPVYAQLSQKSTTRAAQFSWSEIARNTLHSYQTALAACASSHSVEPGAGRPLPQVATESPNESRTPPAMIGLATHCAVVSGNSQTPPGTSVICTLYEGNYHAGLGALVNSLYARGFRGDFYAGFRGELAPWSKARVRQDGTGWVYEVGEGCRLHFIPMRPPQHFNNYKPDFVLSLMEEHCPEAENFFFFDPDIIVKADWDFFERWVSRGIALCEDVNDYLPRQHPVRQAWKEYLAKAGLQIRQEPEKFYNAGFFGLRREHKSFLDRWKQLFGCRAADGADLSNFVLFDFEYPYMSTDQDLMNVALTLVAHPITAVGPEGMGFRPGGYLMSHSAGDIKSWRKRFLWEALKGRAPTTADKEFIQYTRTPIKVCSGRQLAVKRMGITMGALIGRFYRRGGA